MMIPAKILLLLIWLAIVVTDTIAYLVTPRSFRQSFGNWKYIVGGGFVVFYKWRVYKRMLG